MNHLDNGDGGTLGNDVSLTVQTLGGVAVPEPATWLAGALVLGAPGCSQRHGVRRWLGLDRRSA